MNYIFLISVFEDRTYTNLCVPAFMDPPSQNQPEVSNRTQENLASQNVDEMESNEPKSTNSQKWYSSPTLQKVAYSTFLHAVSGAIYGSYSIYLNISKPTIDKKQFFIALGCYLLGIGLYLLFVAFYYKVLIFQSYFCFFYVGCSYNRCYVKKIIFVCNFCILLNDIKVSLIGIIQVLRQHVFDLLQKQEPYQQRFAFS